MKLLDWSLMYDTYSESIVKQAVPSVDGVYLIYHIVDNVYRVYNYVGQGNLQSRLLGHLSDEESNIGLKTRVKESHCGFVFAPLDDAKERDGIEKYLYDFLSSNFVSLNNQVSPHGDTSIPINMPEDKFM